MIRSQGFPGISVGFLVLRGPESPEKRGKHLPNRPESRDALTVSVGTRCPDAPRRKTAFPRSRGNQKETQVAEPLAGADIPGCRRQTGMSAPSNWASTGHHYFLTLTWNP